MSMERELQIQSLLNQLEDLVADQDYGRAYHPIKYKRVHISVLGGKYAQAEKDFLAALRQYRSDKDKDRLAAAVDEHFRRMTEAP
jgi:hypothetical protein